MRFLLEVRELENLPLQVEDSEVFLYAAIHLVFPAILPRELIQLILNFLVALGPRISRDMSLEIPVRHIKLTTSPVLHLGTFQTKVCCLLSFSFMENRGVGIKSKFTIFRYGTHLNFKVWELYFCL